MEESTPQFSSLIDLFDSINVVEKGIENVYRYLLLNQSVDDLKGLVDALGLNLKRVYKICSVLKDLGLVQIFDRPMKIQLLDPIKSWETLIQNTINEIQSEANEKIKTCQQSLERMVRAFNLNTESKQQPVEFISYMGNIDIESVFYSLVADKESCIAHGIWYYKESIFKGLKIESDEKEGLKKIFNALKKVTIKVLTTKEYLENMDRVIEDYKFMQQLLDELHIDKLSFDIRVSDKPFSNFIVNDMKKLIQPSFDPNENLIGYYVSSPKEIVDVFYKKFNDLFEKAVVLKEKKSLLFQLMISL
jgi:hypothetical protein